MPDGTIIGARGPNGPLAPKSALNDWFHKIYTDRYGTPPTYPSYQMAQSMLGLKVAWEKAQKEKGGASRPPTRSWPRSRASRTKARAARSSWRSATATRASRTPPTAPTGSTSRRAKPEVVDVMRFPAECVNPPAGIDADDWIKDGMKGAKCN